jgi:MFS family permease
MTAIGRYYLDTIVDYIDRTVLLQVAGVLACLGLSLVGLAPSLPSYCTVPIVILGFGICGAGLSTVAPIIIYYAGTSVRGMPPSQAIATVSSASYLGVLLGPPLFGGLAELLKGLRWSLLLDGALMLSIFFLARLLPGRKMQKNEENNYEEGKNEMKTTGHI